MNLLSTSKLVCTSLLMLIMGCHSSEYSTDPKVIAQGQEIFDAQCTTCHSFQRSGIGPALGGISLETSGSWLREFIKNPGAMINKGDKRAVELHEKYSTIMPAFDQMNDDEITAILAYLNTHQERPEFTASEDIGILIEDPIPDTVPMSDIVLQLRLIATAPATTDKRPLARINKMIPEPGGADRLFIADLNGVLYIMNGSEINSFLKISDYFDQFINKPGLGTGFGSFAFHPDFQNNGLFYTSHTEDPKTSSPADFTFHDSIPPTVRWVLTEWKMADPGASSFTGSHRELMRVDMVSGIHGMQEITFNPTARPADDDYGLLYIGIGDGGAMMKGYTFIPHNKAHVWGTILRIDPLGHNSSNGHYGIPATNPFVKEGDTTAMGEIYAMGFRNPHRIIWDTGGDGKMLASNIGQKHIEELNLILPGQDYGWPEREGTFLIDKTGDLDQVYPLPKDEATFNYTYPVLQFDHDESSAISSGFVYYGNDIPFLQGKYFFGGITDGRIYYAEADELKPGQQAPFYETRLRLEDGPIEDLHDLTGSEGRVDLRFGIDSDGEIYIFTKADGKVYKVIKADEGDEL